MTLFQDRGMSLFDEDRPLAETNIVKFVTLLQVFGSAVKLVMRPITTTALEFE